MAFIHDLLRKELIDGINKGIVDLGKVEWSSFFRTTGYYDIVDELFDKISDEHVKDVFDAYIDSEWCSWDKKIQNKSLRKEGQWFLTYGFVQLASVEERVKRLYPKHKRFFTKAVFEELKKEERLYFLDRKVQEVDLCLKEIRKELKRLYYERRNNNGRLPCRPQELRELHTQGRCMSSEQQETPERLRDE